MNSIQEKLRWTQEALQAALVELAGCHDCPLQPPCMMPGQEPYTACELGELCDLVGEAAEGDPGERYESVGL
jgi:hypothetical protein